MTKSILQQQQLIELIRESRVEDAIRFSSEQLAERGEEDPAVLEELERTLALLAFEDPHQSPFSDLLSHSHRQKVSNSYIMPLEELLCNQINIRFCITFMLLIKSKLLLLGCK